MTALSRHRVTVVWLLLVTATLAGFGTAGLSATAGWAFAVVMLVAAFKAALITRHYMDLNHAPIGWQLAFGGLIALATIVIIVLHFVPLL